MAAVLEPPETKEVVYRAPTQPLPMWILLLIRPEEGYDPPAIREILQMTIPELGKIHIQRITDEMKVSGVGLVYRGVREIVEHYESLLKEHDLQTRIEPEA